MVNPFCIYLSIESDLGRRSAACVDSGRDQRARQLGQAVDVHLAHREDATVGQGLRWRR